MKKIIALPLLLGVLVFFYTSFINPWSRINCWTNEVDIYTGQKRYTRYIAFFPTKREITNTWVSESLKEEQKERQWRTTSTLTPTTKHSPNYSFHSALADLNSFSFIIDHDLIEKDALPLVAQNVLKLWKEHDSDYEAGQFLMSIESESYKKVKIKRQITLEDIELLIAKTNQSEQ
jgi:hypothetical protein